MPPPLPPGFVLAPASAPPTAPAGRPTLTPLGPPHQPAPPSGYQPVPGGLAPIPGGPAEQPPSGYRYRPDRSLEPIPGGPADTSPHLGPPPGNAALHGDAYLSSLDPGLADRVRALSDGRLQVPTGRALAVPYWQTTLAAALQYDPTLDEANARTRIATRHSRAVGPIGNNITALNTAIGHLGRLANRADELGNGEFTPWNSLRNTVTSAFGNTAPGNFQADVQAASDELEKAFRATGGGSLEGIRGWQDRLSSASTPEQLHGVINEITGLLHSRIVAIGQQYDAGMGRSSDPLQLVSPEARAVLDAIHRGQTVPDNLITAATGLPPDPNAPPPPPGTQPPNPPEGGGLGGLLHSVSTPPINPSTPGAPDQQRGAVEFGVAPHVPTGFEQDQIAAYDAFNRANPHATAAQLRQAFPNVSNADQIVAFRDQHGFVAPGSTYVMASGNDTPEARRARAIAARAAAEPAGVSPVDILPPVLLARMLARSLSGDEAANAVQRGATDTLTMGGADEATAALASAGENGTYDENVAIQRGIADYDSRSHPISRFAGQFAGGLALPVGEAPTIGRLAAAGAGYGAAYGFGSGEGVTDRLIRAGEGGAAGGIVAPAIKLGADAAGTAYRALRSLGSSGSSAVADAGGPSAPDLIAAAERQGLQNPAADGTPGASPLPADVGGPVTRGVTAGARQLPFASMPITNAANALQSRVGARVGELAGEHGGALPPDQFGDFARTSLENFNKTSGEQGGRTYNRARDLAGDQQFIGMDAVRTIDRHLAELEDNPNTNAPLIAGLERLRGDLAQPEAGLRLKSIDAIRQLRTSVRAEAQTEALRGTDYQRRAGEVLDSLSNDISADLSPEARFAFRHADAQWKDRLDFIDNIETNILGPQNSRSAEQIVQRLTNMSRTDSAGMRTLLQTLPQNEAGVIRASLINQLGRPAPGQAAGHDFSLSTFLTNWNKIKDNARAIENLFPGSQRSDINDLAMIAAGTRRSAAIANNSNSGNAINVGRTVGNLASLGGIVKTLGVSNPNVFINGRLLASPRFARWLARPPADPGVGMRRLAQLAAAEPQLSADIIPIQRALETTTRSAAAQDENNRR